MDNATPMILPNTGPKCYYIEVPRTGTKCPYSGLSRSGIYNLIRPTKANGYKAVVKSANVPLPGNKRGRRVVHYTSLMNYLNGRAVPVEMLNLRRAWQAFLSEPRCLQQSALVDVGEVRSLSDDEAEVVERAASAALHRTSRAARATPAPRNSDDSRNDSAG